MSDNNEIQLTGRQITTLSTIFIQSLSDPERMKSFLDDPDEVLTGLGMDDQDIVTIMEYLINFKAALEEALGDDGDFWPPAA